MGISKRDRAARREVSKVRLDAATFSVATAQRNGLVKPYDLALCALTAADKAEKDLRRERKTLKQEKSCGLSADMHRAHKLECHTSS